ncbi:MAG: hypothetical protein GEU28_03745 [Dehalococcoidia bacterium]|nr:hypothetical protein [Dehalococcoidia bacterium]
MGLPEPSITQQATPQSQAEGRAFAMGFSHFAPETTPEAYEEVFRRAAAHGEMILVQRAPVWTSFLPGAAIEEPVAASARLDVELASQYGLDLYVAIDPTDPTDRGRLTSLPAGMEGSTLRDPALAEAYVSYARFMAENYRPRYMALAVEVNLIFGRNAALYDEITALFGRARREVKSVSPSTTVFVTFQYEALQGTLGGDEHEPRWGLLDDFAGLDMIGISSYPGFAFGSSSDIPGNYYAQILDHTDLPVAIAEMGFNSEAAANGGSPRSEEEQNAFLRKALDQVERFGLQFVMWYVSADPTFEPPAPFNTLSSIGLIRPDGSEKDAWRTWAATSARNYDGSALTEVETSPDAPPGPTPSPGISASTPTPTP